MRTVTLEVPHDTRLFLPHQMQIDPLMATSFSFFAEWSRRHWISMPELLSRYRVGLVVVGVHLEFTHNHAFFDAEAFDFTGSMQVHGGGRVVAGHYALISGGAEFARGLVPCRPLLIGDSSLAATPANLPPELLDLFAPDEVHEASLGRHMPSVDAPAVACVVRPVRVLPQHCEFADQWYFGKLPALTEVVRFDCVEQHSEQLAATRAMVLRRLDVEIRRPAFVYDTPEVTMTAHPCADGDVIFRSLFTSTTGHRETLAVVQERFSPPAALPAASAAA